VTDDAPLPSIPIVHYAVIDPADTTGLIRECGAQAQDVIEARRAAGETILDAPADVSCFTHKVVAGRVVRRSEAEIVAAMAPPPPDMTAARRMELSSTDWTQAADSPLSDAQRQAWRIYRQAVRDIPTSGGVWPARPDGLLPIMLRMAANNA
jgi:hypothetical protein